MRIGCFERDDGKIKSGNIIELSTSIKSSNNNKKKSHALGRSVGRSLLCNSPAFDLENVFCSTVQTCAANT